MSTTLSFRRSAFVSAPPLTGSFIRTKSGKAVLRVQASTVFRRAGERADRDMIRLQVTKVSATDLPPDVAPQPWPVQAKVKPTPSAPIQLRAPAAPAPTHIPAAKSKKQKRRDTARSIRNHLADLESPVPHAQRAAVLDGNGKVFTPPKVVSASWRDPDDSNVRSRAPRLSHGFRPTDPVLLLHRVNPAVEIAHVVASDFYRMAWERGPGGGLSSGRDLVFCDRTYTPSGGPTETACVAMRHWLEVQSRFPPRAQAALDAIVLNRMAVTTWATKQRGDRRYWVGFVVAVLDQLLLIYRDDVDAKLKQEHVALD